MGFFYLTNYPRSMKLATNVYSFEKSMLVPTNLKRYDDHNTFSWKKTNFAAEKGTSSQNNNRF